MLCYVQGDEREKKGGREGGLACDQDDLPRVGGGELGFRVSGSGFRVSDLGLRVSGSGFRVSGLGMSILSLERCMMSAVFLGK